MVLSEPLSFWGGLEPASGTIIDERHPQRGQRVGGRVLVMPAGRGSSSSSSVLAEAIRGTQGPRAIVLAQRDDIVVLGALVVSLLDGRICPVLQLATADYARIADGDELDLLTGGWLAVTPARALT